MADFPELSQIVPEYHSRNPVVRWLFHQRLEEALKLGGLDASGPLDLADVGCGEGLFVRLLRERFPGHRVSGFDHNPGVKRLAVAGATVARRDLARPADWPRAAFDRVFCLDVLEHLEDLSGPLASLREALRPGGLLVLSAPSENVFHKTCRFLIKGTFSEKAGPASSPHFHRAETLRAQISAAGFEPLRRVGLPCAGPLMLLELSSFRRK